MNKDKRKYWLLIGVWFLALVAMIVITWSFTGQTAELSNTKSAAIAKYVENSIGNHFVINANDHFWRKNMNELVRKGAHVAEYFLLGFITCTLGNIALRRVWLALITSLTLCSIYAYIDEYRQNFFMGRSPRWFDWRLDLYGILFGVLTVTILFLILRYIQKLKKRINELEGR